MARKARHGAGGQTARLLVALLVFLSIAAPVISGPAGSVQKQGNPFLVGAYFQARQLKEQAEQAISRLEAEIQRNREVAAKSRKLMELASQRSDDNARRAEQTAAQALRLAEESIARNEKTLARWQAAKSRAERSMGELMRMLKEGRPGEGAILGQVSSLGGRAQIFRRDGTTLNLEGDMPGFLSPGERIKTTDGPVEFRALGGRATAQLDRESELAVLDEKEDKECFELVKGRLHGLVDKADDFLARLKKGFDDYREDLGTIKDYFTDDEVKAAVDKRIDIWFRWAKGEIKLAHLITVTAVLGIRGTEYLIQRHADNSAEVWVLEGEVELTFPDRGEPTIIRAGYRCAFNENGPSAPVAFDAVEKWWEKKEGSIFPRENGRKLS